MEGYIKARISQWNLPSSSFHISSFLPPLSSIISFYIFLSTSRLLISYSHIFLCMSIIKTSRLSSLRLCVSRQVSLFPFVSFGVVLIWRGLIYYSGTECRTFSQKPFLPSTCLALSCTLLNRSTARASIVLVMRYSWTLLYLQTRSSLRMLSYAI